MTITSYYSYSKTLSYLYSIALSVGMSLLLKSNLNIQYKVFEIEVLLQIVKS